MLVVPLTQMIRLTIVCCTKIVKTLKASKQFEETRTDTSEIGKIQYVYVSNQAVSIGLKWNIYKFKANKYCSTNYSFECE